MLNSIKHEHKMNRTNVSLSRTILYISVCVWCTLLSIYMCRVHHQLWSPYIPEKMQSIINRINAIHLLSNEILNKPFNIFLHYIHHCTAKMLRLWCMVYFVYICIPASHPSIHIYLYRAFIQLIYILQYK